jgi:cation diffusion facilitator family transporter
LAESGKKNIMTESEKIGAYSIGINVLLVGIKALLAFLSGSLALIADAIHSFSDVISSATVFAGIKISKRKSKRFPYGLYKVENLVALISAILIFIVGYEIVRTVFFEQRLLKRENIPCAIAGVLLTMAITFAFSRYELRQGERIGSPSLVADAKHIHADMLSSSAILIGLISSWFGLNLDRIATVFVLLFVLKAGVTILVDSLRVLLDASIDFETMDKVKTIISNDSKVTAINGIWGRNSGPYKFIEADIVIKTKELKKAYQVSQRIEKTIKKEISNIDNLLIHYRTEVKKTTTCAIPLSNNKSDISDHFGDAPYFFIVTVRNADNTILNESYRSNPFAHVKKGKGIKASEWLLKQGVDTVYSPKMLEGTGPGYVLADGGVDNFVTANKKLEDVRRKIVSGQGIVDSLS